MLRAKKRGVGAFCRQPDLLTTRKRSGLSDALEHEFESIDTPGINARNVMLGEGVTSLSPDERCDFAYFLMSLELRRRNHVEKGRAAAKSVKQNVDNDLELHEAIRSSGIVETPSQLWESNRADVIFEEESFLRMMRNVARDPETRDYLVNANWFIVSLGQTDGTLVLADRPLVKTQGYFSPPQSWWWLLPLSPRHALVITPNKLKLEEPKEFRQWVNNQSATQADKYVFSIDEKDSEWLGSILSR